METAPTKQALIALAYAHVYEDAEQLIQDFTRTFALTNSGQVLTDYVSSPSLAQRHPGSILRGCWSSFYGQAEGDEMAAGMEAERKSWLKDAKRCVKAVQKKGLPLTMKNAEDAWSNRGAFAK